MQIYDESGYVTQIGSMKAGDVFYYTFPDNAQYGDYWLVCEPSEGLDKILDTKYVFDLEHKSFYELVSVFNPNQLARKFDEMKMDIHINADYDVSHGPVIDMINYIFLIGNVLYMGSNDNELGGYFQVDIYTGEISILEAELIDDNYLKCRCFRDVDIYLR